jgi:hypothetical protein
MEKREERKHFDFMRIFFLLSYMTSVDEGKFETITQTCLNLFPASNIAKLLSKTIIIK